MVIKSPSEPTTRPNQRPVVPNILSESSIADHGCLADGSCVGAGPAGKAQLAGFQVNIGLYLILIDGDPRDLLTRTNLGGFSVLMISRAGSVSSAPRAHITSSAAFQCLRSIGLDDACRALAIPRDNVLSSRMTYTFFGEKFSRLHSWGKVGGQSSTSTSLTAC